MQFNVRNYFIGLISVLAMFPVVAAAQVSFVVVGRDNNNRNSVWNYELGSSQLSSSIYTYSNSCQVFGGVDITDTGDILIPVATDRTLCAGSQILRLFRIDHETGEFIDQVTLISGNSQDGDRTFPSDIAYSTDSRILTGVFGGAAINSRLFRIGGGSIPIDLRASVYAAACPQGDSPSDGFWIVRSAVDYFELLEINSGLQIVSTRTISGILADDFVVYYPDRALNAHGNGGMDRTSDGTLYFLSGKGRVYRLDPDTAVATLIDTIASPGTDFIFYGIASGGVSEFVKFAGGVCGNSGNPISSWHSPETWWPNTMPSSKTKIQFSTECEQTPDTKFVAEISESAQAFSIDIDADVDATLSGVSGASFVAIEDLNINGTLGMKNGIHVFTNKMSLASQSRLRIELDTVVDDVLNSAPQITILGDTSLSTLAGSLEIQVDPAFLANLNQSADAFKARLIDFELSEAGAHPEIGRFHTFVVTDLNGEPLVWDSPKTFGIMYSNTGIDVVVVNTLREVVPGTGGDPFSNQPIANIDSVENLSIVTHGTNSSSDGWSSVLAAWVGLQSDIDSNMSTVFDWREENLSGGIEDLIGGAGNTSRRAYELGESIAFWIDQVRENRPLNSVHIYGHSSGAWFTEGFTSRYSELHPETFLESTMFDANNVMDDKTYEPNGFHKLGESSNFSTNVVDRRTLVCSLNYFIEDHTADFLPHAINLDVTPADLFSMNSQCGGFVCAPICYHAWPYNWYQQVVQTLPINVSEDSLYDSEDPSYWGFMRSYSRRGVRPFYGNGVPGMGGVVSIHPFDAFDDGIEDSIIDGALQYACLAGCCLVIDNVFRMSIECAGLVARGARAEARLEIDSIESISAIGFNVSVSSPGAQFTAESSGELFENTLPSDQTTFYPVFLYFNPPIDPGTIELALNANFIYGSGEVVVSDMYVQISDLNQFCIADMNSDGRVNFFDVSAFLDGYSSGDPLADFDNNGIFNFFDVSTFLTAYSSGCP